MGRDHAPSPTSKAKAEHCAPARHPRQAGGRAPSPVRGALEREADALGTVAADAVGPEGRGALTPPSGGPLPAPLRESFERHFGASFADVRIHHDGSAARAAEAESALAYTAGPDIVFNRAQYAPNTRAGLRLLGHELVHVMQQRGGAAVAAARVGSATPGAIQRQDAGAAPGAQAAATDACVDEPNRLAEIIEAARQRVGILRRASAFGLLFEDEGYTPSGEIQVSSVPRSAETVEARAQRLGRIADQLEGLVAQWESTGRACDPRGAPTASMEANTAVYYLYEDNIPRWRRPEYVRVRDIVAFFSTLLGPEWLVLRGDARGQPAEANHTAPERARVGPDWAIYVTRRDGQIVHYDLEPADGDRHGVYRPSQGPFTPRSDGEGSYIVVDGMRYDLNADGTVTARGPDRAAGRSPPTPTPRSR